MSALIECCIELGGAAPPPEEQAPPTAAAATPPEPAGARGAPLRRQESVTRPRLQRLATIDYVREGATGDSGGTAGTRGTAGTVGGQGDMGTHAHTRGDPSMWGGRGHGVGEGDTGASRTRWVVTGT